MGIALFFPAGARVRGLFKKPEETQLWSKNVPLRLPIFYLVKNPGRMNEKVLS